jgi:hypothetical protein
MKLDRTYVSTYKCHTPMSASVNMTWIVDAFDYIAPYILMYIPGAAMLVTYFLDRVDSTDSPQSPWAPLTAKLSLKNRKGLPPKIRDAAEAANVDEVQVYGRCYHTGGIAWRFSIDGVYYYPTRTLLIKRGVITPDQD